MSKIGNIIKKSETKTPSESFVYNKTNPKIADNKEMVNHPDHYDMADKTYEPYKVITAWEANFNIGNAIKYLARYKKKWNPIEDLQKAKQYIDFEIEHLNKMTSND